MDIKVEGNYSLVILEATYDGKQKHIILTIDNQTGEVVEV